MTSRRRAVFHFLTSVVFLLLSDRLRTSSSFDTRPQWNSRWVVVGGLWAVLSARLYDVDYRDTASNRRRRAAVVLVQNAVRHRHRRRDETASYEFGMGGSLGSALYRLRYGVLGSPPGEE
ncbi:hypothetical protein [Halomarina oriensis]|uniref:DUF8097 domain-containing protein n=1 Tax=Halomarina oriensis TaxID=671145 RepID=A0A6B0GKQ4_9EURY|nr:hypothetical protein [Halomarina oriensis]MWG35324.1 hypothetical protein [Halomarina oriensis]